MIITFIFWHKRILSLYCSICRSTFKISSLKKHIERYHDVYKSFFNFNKVKSSVEDLLRISKESALNNVEKEYYFYNEGDKKKTFHPFYGFDILNGYQCCIEECFALFQEDSSRSIRNMK